ncbi:hypothetical protein AB3N02_22095 [Priestia aryabhattai]|uniref:hypothetical protein n=1 Tax=Priestia aryabhattai TaxID=412384 RepID=UPI0039A1E7AA
MEKKLKLKLYNGTLCEVLEVKESSDNLVAVKYIDEDGRENSTLAKKKDLKKV